MLWLQNIQMKKRTADATNHYYLPVEAATAQRVDIAAPQDSRVSPVKQFYILGFTPVPSGPDVR